MTSEHFSDRELRDPVSLENKCTPRLLDALEAFRTIVRSPVIVNSAYRSPEHNAAVGGAPDSQHVLGNAADILVAGWSPARMERAARRVPAIRGIGRADRQGYIHVDVRPGPLLAKWCYDAGGNPIRYYPPQIDSNQTEAA